MTDPLHPWRTLSSELQYDNPWIRVREDQVRRPDGRPGIYGVVTFKHRATGVVPLTPEGDTFLVGQHRYPLDRYSWEIPEGGAPLGEDPLMAARRELVEETGLVAARWTYLGELHTSNSVTDELGVVYLAEELTQGPSAPEGTECLAVRRLPLEQAYLMAMGGAITDAVSVVALARAWHYLAAGRRASFVQGPLAPRS